LSALVPQSVAAYSPLGPRISSGWTSRAITASFTSRAPTLRPRYSGLRPTIWPARNTPMIRNSSRLIMPTPLPPNTQFSHMPMNGDRLAVGVRLVVLGVHRPARHVGGDGGEDGPRRCAKPQLL